MRPIFQASGNDLHCGVNFALEPLRVRWEGAELTAIDDPTGQLFCGPNTKVNSLRPPTDFPWTVFVQEKPFVLFVVLDQRREKVLLVKQKRPGDENTIEAPGGAASTLLDGLKNELLQEAGVDLESIEHLAVAAPMAHDVARKLLPDGSPMPVYMVLVQLKKRTRLKAHAFNDNEGVEATQANWYDRDEVMNLIRTGRLYDLPTLSALRLSGLIPTFLVW